MERFLKYFKPEKYTLDLTIDKSGRKIVGEEKIIGESLGEEIRLHAVNMKISKVLVGGEAAEFKYFDDVLSLATPKGEVEIAVSYEARINENMEGAYLSTYEYEGRTEEIVTTQFESHYARQAFPCVDEPAAKAVFEVSITADANDIVLFNTPQTERYLSPRRSRPSPRGERANSRAAALRNAPDSIQLVAFEPTPRMSTYLVAFVVGKLQGKSVMNRDGVEITTYCALNQPLESVEFANEVAARSLEFYTENFGVAYPLRKLDQVALPDFEAGAMENWGLVTYRETMLLAGKSATLGTKKGVAVTVAHELAHQWFGDLVTMAWWDDLWLNESFASVMEYYAVDAIYPEFNIFEAFFTGDCLAALRRDCLTGVQAVHQAVEDPEEIESLFDPAIVYAKGARLMLMLIRAMGWKAFCSGIQEYFEKFAYGNTVGDDLWRSLTPHAEFDVKKMMHAFIDQPGYPVVTARRSSGSSKYFALEETEFAEEEQRKFLLDGEMTASDWPLPAIAEDMSGHYILNLSEEQFSERLARFEELSLEEKLRLLIDRGLLCKTELAASASLVPLIARFASEGSAAVWSLVSMVISDLKIFFESGTAEDAKFRKFVKDLAAPKLSELGLTTREGDDDNTIRLRGILMGLDFFGSNYEGADVENLRKLAGMYITDYAVIDPEIRDDIFDAKMFLEPGSVDEFLQAYAETADPEVKFDLLYATTMTQDAEALAKVAELLEKPEIVKPQDQFYLFIWLFRNRFSKDAMFDWLASHWEYVRETVGDKTVENYPRYMAASIRTPEDYARWREIFEPLADETAIARAVAIGRNEIEARLKLIAEDGEGVVESLD